LAYDEEEGGRIRKVKN